MEGVAARLGLIAERKLAKEIIEDVIRSEGHLDDSRSKNLVSSLPIIYLKAVPVTDAWTPTSTGRIRGEKRVYDCPVYFTSNRETHYIFLAGLRTLELARKWTIAGVALLMQTDD